MLQDDLWLYPSLCRAALINAKYSGYYLINAEALLGSTKPRALVWQHLPRRHALACSVPAAAAVRLGLRPAHSSRAGLCRAVHSWQQGYGAPRAVLCGLSAGSMAMPGMGLPRRALHHAAHGGAAWAAGRCSRLSPF